MQLGHATSLQIQILRAIHDQNGIDAFDHAVREQFEALAGIIAHVLGPQRLADLLDVIAKAHPIEG